MFQLMLQCKSVGVLTCWWLVLVTGENTSLRGMIGSELSSPTDFLLLGIHSCCHSFSITKVSLRSFKKAFVPLGWHEVSWRPCEPKPMPMTQGCGMRSWGIFHVPLPPVSHEMVFKLVE